MYESGIPPWAVLLPSYGMWYRPWLRQLAWLVALAISFFSMTSGMYDLYRHVPFLKQAISVAAHRVALPVVHLFEWIEIHTQVRFTRLFNYLFRNSPLLISLSQVVRNAANLVTQFVTPLVSGTVTFLRPLTAFVMSYMIHMGSMLGNLKNVLTTIAMGILTLLAVLLGPFVQLLRSFVAAVIRLFALFALLFRALFGVPYSIVALLSNGVGCIIAFGSDQLALLAAGVRGFGTYVSGLFAAAKPAAAAAGHVITSSGSWIQSVGGVWTGGGGGGGKGGDPGGSTAVNAFVATTKFITSGSSNSGSSSSSNSISSISNSINSISNSINSNGISSLNVISNSIISSSRNLGVDSGDSLGGSWHAALDVFYWVNLELLMAFNLLKVAFQNMSTSFNSVVNAAFTLAVTVNQHRCSLQIQVNQLWTSKRGQRVRRRTAAVRSYGDWILFGWIRWVWDLDSDLDALTKDLGRAYTRGSLLERRWEEGAESARLKSWRGKGRWDEEEEEEEEEEPEKYEKHFSQYVEEDISGEDLEDLYKEVHAAIRANPVHEKKERSADYEKKNFKEVRLTYDQRKENLKEKLAALREEDDE